MRWQRMRRLDGITNSMDMSFSKLQDIVKDRAAWHAAVHGVVKTEKHALSCVPTNLCWSPNPQYLRMSPLEIGLLQMYLAELRWDLVASRIAHLVKNPPGERLPAPVYWPGEVHGLYSPSGRKELDMTERLWLFTFKVRPYWSSVGSYPNLIDLLGVFIQRRRKTHRRVIATWKWKQRLELCCHKTEIKRIGRTFSWRLQRHHGPAETLISEFCPPEWGRP